MDRTQLLESIMNEYYGYCIKGFQSRMIDLAGLPDEVYEVSLPFQETITMLRDLNRKLISEYQCFMKIDSNFNFNIVTFETEPNGRKLLHETRYENVDVIITGMKENNPEFIFETNNHRSVRVANVVVDYIQHTVLTYLLNNDRESNVNIRKLWGGKQWKQLMI